MKHKISKMRVVKESIDYIDDDESEPVEEVNRLLDKGWIVIDTSVSNDSHDGTHLIVVMGKPMKSLSKLGVH